jgi:hypothetical protein
VAPYDEGDPMKSYEARATIDAPPDRVWAVLIDAAGYPAWDSGVDRVDGRIAAGEKITVHAAVSKGRAFPVTVTSFEPPGRMVWNGGMPLGLFKGVRTFTLTPQGNSTEFTVREEYTGPLLPLIWRSMPDLGPSFTRFANGLKQRVEKV